MCYFCFQMRLSNSFLYLEIITVLPFAFEWLYQDIPDVDGDRDYGIQSFSVTLGQQKVSKTNPFSFLFRFSGFQQTRTNGKY